MQEFIQRIPIMTYSKTGLLGRTKRHSIRFSTYIIASFFLFSGLAKLVSPNETFQAIAKYIDIGDVLLLKYLIVTLSVLEMGIGVALLGVYGERISQASIYLATLMSSAFLGVAGFRIVTMVGGDCGCTGAVKLLSNPWVALSTDLTLLSLCGICIQSIDARGRQAIYLLVLPIALGANIFIGATSGTLNVARRLESEVRTDVTSWYGIPATRFNGMDAKQYILQCTALDTIEVRSVSDLPLHEVLGGGSDDEKLVAWLVMELVPVKKPYAGIYELALVYDTNLNLLDVNVEKVAGFSVGWPQGEEIESFLGGIERQRAMGDLVLFNGVSNAELRSNPDLGKHIIAAVNNATNCLVTKSWEEQE